MLALCIVFFPGFFGNMLMMVAGIILVVEAVSDLIAIHYLDRLSGGVTVTYNVSD